MFGQMKDLYKMQKQAREMQKQMKKLKIKGKSDDEMIVISINVVSFLGWKIS